LSQAEKVTGLPLEALEKLKLSLTIEKAETYVSVHSSHHTPPGLRSGGSLLYIYMYLYKVSSNGLIINCLIAGKFMSKCIVFNLEKLCFGCGRIA